MLMEWGIEAKNRPQNVEKKKLGLAPDLDLVYSEAGGHFYINRERDTVIYAESAELGRRDFP